MMSDAVIVAAIAAVPATLAVLVSLNNARKINTTQTKVQDLHIIVNDRLSQLLKRTAESSRAEGIADERAAGAARAADTAVASAVVTADLAAAEQAAAEARTPTYEHKEGE